MPSKPAVFHGSPRYPALGPRPAVTIGNFDGVHLGHQALIARTVARAAEVGGPATVYTFHPAPRDVLRPGNDVYRIQTLQQRIALLGSHGVDQVVVEPFTRELGGMGARWFVDIVLGERLRAAAVVLGWDFRFGRGREGTVDDVRSWLDVPVEQVEPVRLSDQIVSSSRIREALRDGDVGVAATLLGRPHCVEGAVIEGDRRGRSLGFPTANVQPEGELLPAHGVYAVRVTLPDGAVCDGVANLGVRPTVGAGASPLEVHLLDCEADLYGQRLRVSFLARLRAERRFDNLDALIAQIRDDIAAARHHLAMAP